MTQSIIQPKVNLILELLLLIKLQHNLIYHTDNSPTVVQLQFLLLIIYNSGIEFLIYMYCIPFLVPYIFASPCVV